MDEDQPKNMSHGSVLNYLKQNKLIIPNDFPNGHFPDHSVTTAISMYVELENCQIRSNPTFHPVS